MIKKYINIDCWVGKKVIGLILIERQVDSVSTGPTKNKTRLVFYNSSLDYFAPYFLCRAVQQFFFFPWSFC
jgi:hypothetical protein